MPNTLFSMAFLCLLVLVAPRTALAGEQADRAADAPKERPMVVLEMREPGDAGRVLAAIRGDSPAPPPGGLPGDGLPDGGVASADAGDLRAAWYAEPTRRYGHAVLGDAVEAGRLVVRTEGGTILDHDLPETEVFEDITPRLADLDGDGRIEVVTIRSSTRRGASVAVYGVVDGRLVLRAATPFIGRANRWLNIAGIADYLGEGGAQIAYVETPHIGGTLYLWSFENGALRRRAALGGFSNHAIGSRVLALSVTLDLDADGRPELVVPDDRRRVLRVMSAGDGGWRERDAVPLPDRVAGMAVCADTEAGRASGGFLVAFENGAAAIATPSGEPPMRRKENSCP